MLRAEENEIILGETYESLKRKPIGTDEEMIAFHLGVIITMLADISKSLAILADITESED